MGEERGSVFGEEEAAILIKRGKDSLSNGRTTVVRIIRNREGNPIVSGGRFNGKVSKRQLIRDVLDQEKKAGRGTGKWRILKLVREMVEDGELDLTSSVSNYDIRQNGSPSIKQDGGAGEAEELRSSAREWWDPMVLDDEEDKDEEPPTRGLKSSSARRTGKTDVIREVLLEEIRGGRDVEHDNKRIIYLVKRKIENDGLGIPLNIASTDVSYVRNILQKEISGVKSNVTAGRATPSANGNAKPPVSGNFTPLELISGSQFLAQCGGSLVKARAVLDLVSTILQENLP